MWINYFFLEFDNIGLFFFKECFVFFCGCVVKGIFF